MSKQDAASAPLKFEDRWLTSKEAAIYLGVTVATLAKWRQQGAGPPWASALRRDPRYRLSALAKFMEDAVVQNTRQARAVREATSMAVA
jgi:hypothetical protein